MFPSLDFTFNRPNIMRYERVTKLAFMIIIYYCPMAKLVREVWAIPPKMSRTNLHCQSSFKTVIQSSL